MLAIETLASRKCSSRRTTSCKNEFWYQKTCNSRRKTNCVVFVLFSTAMCSDTQRVLLWTRVRQWEWDRNRRPSFPRWPRPSLQYQQRKVRCAWQPTRSRARVLILVTHPSPREKVSIWIVLFFSTKKRKDGRLGFKPLTGLNEFRVNWQYDDDRDYVNESRISLRSRLKNACSFSEGDFNVSLRRLWTTRQIHLEKYS